MKLENVTLKDLGRCKRLVVDKDQHDVVEGPARRPTSRAASQRDRAQIEKTTSDYDTREGSRSVAKLGRRPSRII